jgi:hypothetical protein
MMNYYTIILLACQWQKRDAIIATRPFAFRDLITDTWYFSRHFFASAKRLTKHQPHIVAVLSWHSILRMTHEWKISIKTTRDSPQCRNETKQEATMQRKQQTEISNRLQQSLILHL